MVPEAPVRRMIPVEEAGDPRLEPYRAVRERDLVGRGGRFIAEGEVVLAHLAGQGRPPLESVLVSERRLRAVRNLLGALPGTPPIYVAPQAVLDGVSGFNIHRGLLAVGRRPAEPGPDALLGALPARALAVGLVGLTNHDNVGGIYRNAAAFGVDAVLRDAATCDPLYRKAIRVSVGTTLTVASAWADSGESLIAALLRTGFEPLALSPSGREAIETLARPERAALLLGTEGPGLPSGLLDRCRTVRIRMTPGLDSLNVASAAAIALHRLATA
jgi:tRNA G18 (ribose-2'-O)-methylase SpoU